MERKKILFLIHDLGQGGAEKVLVNLVNNMDPRTFDITVMALFGGGVNEQFLAPHIRLRICHKRALPGNSHVMKLFSPRWLYRHYIREKYQIVVSYLEGPSARIVSGCPDPDTRLACWIHIRQPSTEYAARSFRTPAEAAACYGRFHRLVGVSREVRDTFLRALPVEVPMEVLYNTNETEKIRAQAREAVPAALFPAGERPVIGVGKLLQSKGFHRLIPMIRRLREEGIPAHLYLLGEGPMKEELERLAAREGVKDAVTFLGYQTNPYRYVARCELFLCASRAEGFSTAATEALILGTPVCTVEVSGMKEMLGENNEWGIVTENEDEALYAQVKRLLTEPGLLAHYRDRAARRGQDFRREATVRAVERMLLSLGEVSPEAQEKL